MGIPVVKWAGFEARVKGEREERESGREKRERAG
jgi:hypothetical protein